VSNWIRVNNLFEKFRVREYSQDASLFYILADKGFPELIRTRLKENPHIHVPGERYGYPLFAALANGNKDVVAALLNSPSSVYNGVDITESLNRRKDLKQYAYRTPLSWAAQEGRTIIVKLLLQTDVTDDEVDASGRTPLSRASENGHEEAAELLISKGADVNIPDNQGWTPLLHASEKGHEGVAKLLIDKGADVNVRDKHGWTPLSYASKNGDEGVAKLLIDKGADVNVRDNDGCTPLSRTSLYGHEGVVKLLINKGADVNVRDNNGVTPLLHALLWGGGKAARWQGSRCQYPS
jgi:ankyrin repeat protein